ncbi:keratin, type I cytoskeletal 47 kDa-like [Spea bombifrons]|uniref:keratin, type I cytoskeletal 47 kDa-like n=1 Tax=Spea bombifrons TaxID=233779 RepID=UPI00234B0564|nr:keratin, type I cytoskeletal 47 kDa-like [Spea bombifrons]
MSFSSRSLAQSMRFGGVGSGVHRARSVAGGAGSVRMSSVSASSVSSGTGVGFYAQESVVLQNNGKEVMQNLNDRLASYLERVHSLEKANGELELKIREFYERKAASGKQDFTHYYDAINQLSAQILNASIDNARLVLQIDNAKLAADDFKMKYESEHAMRFGVDSDIAGLRKALDELTINRSDLELEIEGLKEELVFLKKNHEEELLNVKDQVGGNVNVELDSAPPVDLSKILAEVREQYETMVERNRQEVEMWHRSQCDNLNKEVANNDFALQTSKTEVTEMKRTVQSLQIELQSLQHMKHAMEDTLSETEARYGAELERLQALISQIELDLQNVRSDSEHHSLEYQRLLDAKTRLEMEIATYRRLLEGEDSSFLTVQPTQTQKAVISKETITSSSIKKVKTVVEEIVDGKVVSAKVEEMVEKS